MIITNGAKYNSVQIVDTTLGVVYFGDFILEKGGEISPFNVVYKGWRIRFRDVGASNIIKPGVAPFYYAFNHDGAYIKDSQDVTVYASSHRYLRNNFNLVHIMNINLICGGLRRDVYFDGSIVHRKGLNISALVAVVLVNF